MIGVVLALATTMVPEPTRATAARDMLVDQWLPEWQFGESLRNPRRAGQGEHILNPPGEKPILDVALAGGFVLLGEDTDRELLIGAVVIAPPDIVRTTPPGNVPSLDPALFRTLDRPGFARAVMNFRAVPEPDGWTRVTTETRVHAVDRPTQRQFARYWRVIYPGSWIIRWSWLRAIEARLLS